MFSVILFNWGSLAGPGGKDCNTGGIGSTSCTDSGTIEILWGLFGIGYTNSVRCGNGLYACCNSEGAVCYENACLESCTVE